MRMRPRDCDVTRIVHGVVGSEILEGLQDTVADGCVAALGVEDEVDPAV